VFQINAFLSLAIIGAIFAAVQLLVASVAAAFWNFIEVRTSVLVLCKRVGPAAVEDADKSSSGDEIPERDVT